MEAACGSAAATREATVVAGPVAAIRRGGNTASTGGATGALAACGGRLAKPSSMTGAAAATLEGATSARSGGVTGSSTNAFSFSIGDDGFFDIFTFTYWDCLSLWFTTAPSQPTSAVMPLCDPVSSTGPSQPLPASGTTSSVSDLCRWARISPAPS